MMLMLEDRQPEADADADNSEGSCCGFSPSSTSSYSSSFSSSPCSSKNSETSASVTPAFTFIAYLISFALRISGDVEGFPVLGWEFAACRLF